MCNRRRYYLNRFLVEHPLRVSGLPLFVLDGLWAYICRLSPVFHLVKQHEGLDKTHCLCCLYISVNISPSCSLFSVAIIHSSCLGRWSAFSLFMLRVVQQGKTVVLWGLSGPGLPSPSSSSPVPGKLHTVWPLLLFLSPLPCSSTVSPAPSHLLLTSTCCCPRRTVRDPVLHSDVHVQHHVHIAALQGQGLQIYVVKPTGGSKACFIFSCGTAT